MAMRSKADPQWASLVEQWKAEQNELRAKLVVQSLPTSPLPRFIAGADAAFSEDKQTVFAAAVVYDRVEQRVVDVVHAKRPVEVPYVPGFLAFREGPALTDAIAKLKHSFDVICFDGHGYAHPRRCGMAAYMSIKLNFVGIGVAKSLFIGKYDEPGPRAGDSSPLLDKDEQIGLVLRTKDRTRPIFISFGNKVDLATAAQLVLACCTKYRIPEPTRQADIEVAKLKRSS
jgi:deoxyribonuclease V